MEKSLLDTGAVRLVMMSLSQEKENYAAGANKSKTNPTFSYKIVVGCEFRITGPAVKSARTEDAAPSTISI